MPNDLKFCWSCGASLCRSCNTIIAKERCEEKHDGSLTLRWVLEFLAPANKKVKEDVCLFVKDAKTSCFEIDEARQFTTELDAKAYRDKHNLFMFEPKKFHV